MTVASTPSGDPSKRPTPSRIFFLTGGVFALLGFGATLVLALPQTRAVLLDSVAAVQWNAEVHAVSINGFEQAQRVIRPTRAADAALARGSDPLLKTGFGVSNAARLIDAVARVDDTQAERATVTQYIAKRYRVADEVVVDLVDTAYRAGEEYSVDPLIVLAVVATESRYNPIAESVVGAKGLMQIIAKFHPEKLASHGGVQALFEPHVNIRVGTQILREYHRRFGDLEIALQMYAGALDDTDTRYARKVFAERARLQRVLAQARREA